MVNEWWDTFLIKWLHENIRWNVIVSYDGFLQAACNRMVCRFPFHPLQGPSRIVNISFQYEIDTPVQKLKDTGNLIKARRHWIILRGNVISLRNAQNPSIFSHEISAKRYSFSIKSSLLKKMSDLVYFNNVGVINGWGFLALW